MCNFIAELKDVTNKENLFEIQQNIHSYDLWTTIKL